MQASIAKADLHEQIGARCEKLRQCADEVPSELAEGIQAGIEECNDINSIVDRFESQLDIYHKPDAIPRLMYLFESCIASGNEKDCPGFFTAMESTRPCQEFDQAMRSERKSSP
jgi:hypothetical protein